MTEQPVIDVNAYLGDWPFRPLLHRTPATLRRLLKGAGIARALVSPFAAIFRQECESANAEMMRALAGDFGEFMPVPALNPSYPAWEADATVALTVGARGVRLFPSYHAYSLDDAEVRTAISEIATAGLAVFISLRMVDERHHHPRMMVPAVPFAEVAKLAEAAPQARIIVCMARWGEALKMPVLDNVWFDLSGVQGPVGCVESLAERFGAERLLMGTEAPLQYPLPAVAKIHASELPPAARNQVLGGNAAALLGLTES